MKCLNVLSLRLYRQLNKKEGNNTLNLPTSVLALMFHDLVSMRGQKKVLEIMKQKQTKAAGTYRPCKPFVCGFFSSCLLLKPHRSGSLGPCCLRPNRPIDTQTNHYCTVGNAVFILYLDGYNNAVNTRQLLTFLCNHLVT